MALTDISIRAIKPEKRQRTHFDEALPGFGVRVNPGGTKTFVLMHGKQRQLKTIGRVGIITLAQARAKAKEYLAEKTLGQNEGPTLTFEEAYELFKKTHFPKIRKNTANDYEDRIERHFLKKLRKDQIASITPHIISNIIDELLDTPSEANHAFAVGRTFFKWCVKRRYLPHSPLEGMSMPTRVKSRDRVLTDKELVAVWKATADDYPFGTIVRLCITTGQRRTEISEMRDTWIDEKRATITIPAENAKNGNQHTFPMGKITQEIFGKCPSFNGILFPSRGAKGTTFSGWSKAKTKLDNKAKVYDWTLHDLRRTFATKLAALGVQPHIIEKLLNHVSGQVSGVAKIYNRYSFDKEMREAITLYDRHLQKLFRL